MAADMSQDGLFRIDDAARLLKKLKDWNSYISTVK